MESIWVVGLMSGTSLDGIDAAFLKTNGVTIDEMGPGLTVPYDPVFRAQLHALLQAPDSLTQVLEWQLTDHHTQVVRHLMQHSGIHPKLIGFHGQTVYHRPRTASSRAQTLQIGDGQKMAREIGVPVVYDFRRNDIDHGGEGAPLVPVFHQALAQNVSKPVAIANIGGVSNITFLAEDGTLYAGDVGPGCALMDDWVQQRLGVSYDFQGEIARGGHIHSALLNHWLSHPFFQRPLPKSLDRQTFYECLNDCQPLSPPDGAATLTAFTAHALLNGLKLYPSIKDVILTGGGRHNLFLKHLLSGQVGIKTTEDMNWQGDLLEAYAFAYLAVRSYYNLPLTFPTTTGVSRVVSGGKMADLGKH